MHPLTELTLMTLVCTSTLVGPLVGLVSWRPSRWWLRGIAPLSLILTLAHLALGVVLASTGALAGLLLEPLISR